MRGIVVGDVLRRLVARTIAQQIANQVGIEDQSAFLNDMSPIHAILQRNFSAMHTFQFIWRRQKSGTEVPEACATVQLQQGTWTQQQPSAKKDSTLPVTLQGVKIFETSVGTLSIRAAHSVLWDRIPAIENVQAVWLLFLLCAAAKATAVPLSNLACARQHQCENDWRTQRRGFAGKQHGPRDGPCALAIDRTLVFALRRWTSQPQADSIDGATSPSSQKQAVLAKCVFFLNTSTEDLKGWFEAPKPHMCMFGVH